MLTSEQIEALGIDELKAGFLTFMGDVVQGYGDDQTFLPVACPGQESLSVALPGEVDQVVWVR